MITRYILNGVFLLVLYYLLFFKVEPEQRKNDLPVRNFTHIFAADADPDSIILELKRTPLQVYELNMIVDKVVDDGLSETMNGKAIFYAVGKQTQSKIDGGAKLSSLEYLISILASQNIILEIPKSNLSKFFDYFKECLFKGLRCDHLLNRVTTHEYFPAAVLLVMLLLTAGVFLLLKITIVKKLNRFKLTQNETIDHTIPVNSGNS